MAAIPPHADRDPERDKHRDTPQHEVAARKGIGLVERAHGDVLRRPLTDAADLSQRRDRRPADRVGSRAAAARDMPGQRAHRVGPRRHHAERLERRARELRGRRKQAIEILTIGVTASRRPTRCARPACSRPDRICCPRIARTASSNPSHAPGVRMPGCAAIAARSSGSPPRCAAITTGSAPRSNMRRTRSTMKSSARGSGKRTSSERNGPRSARQTLITPCFRPPDRSAVVDCATDSTPASLEPRESRASVPVERRAIR